MNKRKHNGYEDQKYDYLLLKVQTFAFIIMIFCTLTLALVYRFLKCLYIYEVIIFATSSIVGFGIGSIWLKRDFLRFRQGYLDHLDNERKRKLAEEKARLIRKGKKNERKSLR